MIKVEFTDSEKDSLHHERYHHPHPSVRLKMEAVWLKSQQLPHKEICRLTGICSTTLTNYLREYQKGGIEALKTVKFYRPKSELEAHRQKLETYFREHPPATAKEAMATIETLTGIKRSPRRISAFFNRIGMKRRKVGTIPAKADPEVQEKFKREQLEPRIEEAKAEKRVVFFVDAAHFVLSPFLGMLWCFVRQFVRGAPGRQRFNVLAALNAITHELVMVTNDTYITGDTVCELLVQIASLQLGLPITLILDNARYQKCRLVMDLAAKLSIELLFLPTYSPNLNLIERLWKFVKNKCLYSVYYPNFKTFKQAISECLAQTNSTYKNELDTLLALRFQSFKKSYVMTS
jgi:transposase